MLSDPASAALKQPLPPTGQLDRPRGRVGALQAENQATLSVPLSVGFAVYGAPHFGPELQFGATSSVLDFKEQCFSSRRPWGGKSLYMTFVRRFVRRRRPLLHEKIAEVRERLRISRRIFHPTRDQGNDSWLRFGTRDEWGATAANPKEGHFPSTNKPFDLIKDVRQGFQGADSGPSWSVN